MRLLLLPTLVLATALALDQGWAGALPAAATLLWASRGIFAIAFLLAWRFRRGRLAAANLAMAGAAEALILFPPGPDQPLFIAVSFLLPLNLAVLALLGEWRVLSRTGLLRYGVLALQAAFVWASAQGSVPGAVAWLSRTWVPSLPSTAVPQSAVFAFGAATLVVVFCLARRRSALDSALLGMLIAAFLAFEVAATPLLHFAAGGLIAILSQIENAFSLAFEDGLTGLPARRALEENLRHLGRRYAIAMVDIDHFKRLNDRHGHEVGDQVLRLVASRLTKVRGGGTAYRYGGEEFTVLFPRGSKQDVQPHLEDLRRAIADPPFVVRGPARPKKKPRKGAKAGNGTKRLKVTVSIGVADRTAQRTRPEQVLKAADKALYRAKRAGRNRVATG